MICERRSFRSRSYFDLANATRPPSGDSAGLEARLGVPTLGRADREAIRAAGNSQRTVLFKSYSPAGLGLEPGIELNVVAGQLGQAMARAELHNQTGSVP